MARFLGLALVLAALVAAPSLQASGTLTATWQTPTRLAVTWSGAPEGSCLYLNGKFVPVPCGAFGSATLQVGGADTLYTARPDGVLSLDTDTTDPPSTTTLIPWHATILPIIVVGS